MRYFTVTEACESSIDQCLNRSLKSWIEHWLRVSTIVSDLISAPTASQEQVSLMTSSLHSYNANLSHPDVIARPDLIKGKKDENKRTDWDGEKVKCDPGARCDTR